MIKSKRKVYRAVVDTNIIVSGFINKFGPPYQLVSKLQKDLLVLIVTGELWAEYEEVLSRPKLIKQLSISEEAIAAILRRVQRRAIMVTSSKNLPIEIRDPKDEKVFAAALGGKADYLITGDEDLLDLKENTKLGNLKIVNVQEFLKLLREK